MAVTGTHPAPGGPYAASGGPRATPGEAAGADGTDVPREPGEPGEPGGRDGRGGRGELGEFGGGRRAQAGRATVPAANAAQRAAALEALLGDPADPGNPVNGAALLAADARAELLPEGEALLARFGLDAEFVPRELGGRLETLDGLVRVLRPIFRRDATLGLGYGVTSFMAAVPVWTAGTEEQRRRLADLVLGGGRVAFAYHELAHGNDFVRDEFTARRTAAGYLLDGAKPVINNVDRAAAYVFHARTARRGGAHDHSVLFLDPAQLPPDRHRLLGRHPMTGVRGVRAGGLAFDGCPVPAAALVGEDGQGVELALRTFQFTRAAVPAMTLSLAASCLRTAVRYAVRGDRPRASGASGGPGSASGTGTGGMGGTGIDLRHATPVFANALVDLLTCDALALAATRAATLLPGEAGGYAAAVKYLLPKILGETVYDLSIVLGSAVYARTGPYAAFAKHVRDLPVISLGHAGTAACQATLIPRLPVLARRAWLAPGAEEAPGLLFHPDGPQPALDFPGTRPATAARDPLAAVAAAAADAVPGGGPEEHAVTLLARGFTAELAELRGACLHLDALADPAAGALADRYTHLLAAAAVLGLWREQRRTAPHTFLADPAWATVALTRLAARLGGLPGTPPPPLPATTDARIADEVLRRYREARSYDLYDTQLSA
jgi:alkylation response protein AidB-like acyl-CoA dehydrogenase